MSQVTLPTGAKVNIDDKGNIINPDNSIFTGGGKPLPTYSGNQGVDSKGQIVYQSTNPNAPNYLAPAQIGDKSINPTPTTTPLSGGGNTDPAYSQAQKNIEPTAPPTEEDFYTRIQSQLQPVLDKITEAEHAAEMAANVKSTKATSALNFGANARGLAGSSEAASEAGNIEMQRGADVSQALQTQANAMADLAKFAIPEAHQAYTEALARSDTNSLNYIATTQANAQKSVKSLAVSGKTLDSLRQDNPQAYQSLLQYYNGDENVMKADWIAAASPLSLDGGKPIQAGSHLIYTFKDPITGQVFTQNIDTGVPLTSDWKTISGKDGTILQYNQATGETKQLTSADPYYKANQAATLASKQIGIQRTEQLMQARNITMAKNALATSLGTGGKQIIDTYAKGIGPMVRIQNALNTGDYGSVGDQDLVDAMTIINTGSRPTVQQVDAIVANQGLGEKTGVELKKILNNQGGFLGADAKKAILQLASKNFKLYESQYKKLLPQAQKAVDESGATFKLTNVADLNLLQTPDESLNAIQSSGTGTVQDDSGNTINVQQNTDGTFTNVDTGQNYDANGNEI